MCSAFRFCLSLYFDLSPRGIVLAPCVRCCGGLLTTFVDAKGMPVARREPHIPTASRVNLPSPTGWAESRSAFDEAPWQASHGPVAPPPGGAGRLARGAHEGSPAQGQGSRSPPR